MVRNKKLIHIVFLAIVLIALIIGVLWSSRLYYYIMPMTMEKRGLEHVVTSKANIDNQFVWFTYDNGKMKLHYHPDFAGQLEHAVYMDVNNESHVADAKNFNVNNNMSGSMLVTASKEDWDIDGDGKKDSLLLSAKTDTNETQGWSSFSRVIAREDIPFEIVMSDKTQLTLLKDGQPYNGMVKLESARGTRKKIEVKDGLIPFVDVRDLRKGVVVTAEQKDGSYLIGSYICEYHTVFTRAHLAAAMPLWIFFLSVAVGVMVICVVRRIVFKRKYA